MRAHLCVCVCMCSLSLRLCGCVHHREIKDGERKIQNERRATNLTDVLWPFAFQGNKKKETGGERGERSERSLIALFSPLSEKQGWLCASTLNTGIEGKAESKDNHCNQICKFQHNKDTLIYDILIILDNHDKHDYEMMNSYITVYSPVMCVREGVMVGTTTQSYRCWHNGQRGQ